MSRVTLNQLVASFHREVRLMEQRKADLSANKSVKFSKPRNTSKTNNKPLNKPKNNFLAILKRKYENANLKIYADSFENRVLAQRQERNGKKVRLLSKSKKEDIADKVAKQREEREKKPKKIAKPKDPTKVRSRKPAI